MQQAKRIKAVFRCGTRMLETNEPASVEKTMRPAGVEPTFPASEADALSIELRARK